MTIKEEIREERIETVKTFFKDISAGLVIAGIALLVTIVFGIMNRGWQSEMTAKNNEVSQLDVELAKNIALVQDAKAEKASTVIDFERQEVDDLALMSILNEFYEWNTYDEYETKTGALDDGDYKFDFSPSLYLDNEIARGGAFYVDKTSEDDAQQTSLTSSQVITGVTSYITKADGDVYTYYAEVLFTREYCGVKHDCFALISYTVDGDNNISGYGGDFGVIA